MNLDEAHPATWLSQNRTPLAALVLIVLWSVESVAPMFAGRTRRGSHYVHNLGLAAFNSVIASGFALALVSVTEWAHRHSFGLLNLVALPGKWPVVAAILGIDCWQYWWHRFNHQVPLLWRFHAAHHSDADLDASSGVRFHTGELCFSFLARMMVLPLLGITLPQLLLYESLSLPVILFHHSNIRISGRADRCLRWLIATPWMHWVHHSRQQPETDSNYSSFLSIWDRLFGSFLLRQRPSEILLGLDHYTEPEWRQLPGILLSPFRKPADRKSPPTDSECE